MILTGIACELETRDLVNYCNITLIGLHCSPTAEMPTGGDHFTTIAIAAIAVLVSISLVAAVIGIILAAARCRKIRVQGVYGMRPSAHVREMYIYVHTCCVCTVSVPDGCSVCTCVYSRKPIKPLHH